MNHKNKYQIDVLTEANNFDNLLRINPFPYVLDTQIETSNVCDEWQLNNSMPFRFEKHLNRRTNTLQIIRA